MSFEGRSVIITGAGSGIGRGTALAFAKAGASVVVQDIDAARVKETVRFIEESGGQAMGIPGDVTSDAFVKDMVKQVFDRFGRIDVLCNNAGVTDGQAAVDEVSEEVWRRTLDVNLTAQFLTIRAVLPHMLAVKRGVILNTSSVTGIVAISGPAYAASKFGVIGLTQSVAATYGPEGIRCIALCPGQIPSNLSAGVKISESPRVVRRRAHRHDRPPSGKPHHIADVAVFLASDAASFINGSSIVIDNGMLVY